MKLSPVKNSNTVLFKSSVEKKTKRLENSAIRKEFIKTQSISKDLVLWESIAFCIANFDFTTPHTVSKTRQRLGAAINIALLAVLGGFLILDIINFQSFKKAKLEEKEIEKSVQGFDSYLTNKNSNIN